MAQWSSKSILSRNEPPHGKTNNVVSEQVRHKPGCTSTEELEISDIRRRGSVLSVYRKQRRRSASAVCVFVFAYANCWFSHEVAQIKKAMTRNCIVKGMDSEPHKTLYVYVKYHHKFIPGTRECISGLLRKIFVFKVGKSSFFLHLSESPYLSGMVTGLSIITR